MESLLLDKFKNNKLAKSQMSNVTGARNGCTGGGFSRIPGADCTMSWDSDESYGGEIVKYNCLTLTADEGGLC